MIVYFETFIWKVYDVRGTVLVPGAITESETDEILAFMKLTL